MKVLLDECVDPKVRSFFSSKFQVTHIKDLGWLGVKNGELIARADGICDALFTIDGNMAFQTSLKGRTLRVAVGQGHFRSLEAYRTAVEEFERIAESIPPGSYHFLFR